MTIQELSQLYWLNREIELDQERLRDLEAQAYAPPTQKVDGMPHAPGIGDPTATLTAEIEDLRAIIAAKQLQCIHERNRLERYINGIDDSLTRMIFRLRFINGLTWFQVASHVGGNTEDSAKKICYRYLAAKK